LANFPDVDVFRLDAFGKSPTDYCEAEFRKSDPEKCDRILKILKSVEKNFVLLLRDRDLIGKKFEFVQDLAKFERENSQKNGEFFIAGCLGPCAATTAENLKREWDSLRKLKEWKNLILSDAHKGLEMIGRHIAKQRGIQWKEFWAFLDSLCDISNAEGLERFEAYLQHRPEFDYLTLIGNPYSPSPQHVRKLRFSSTPMKASQLDSVKVKLHLQLDDDEENEENYQDANENDNKNADENFFDCFDELSEKLAGLQPPSKVFSSSLQPPSTDFGSLQSSAALSNLQSSTAFSNLQPTEKNEDEIPFGTPPNSPTAMSNCKPVFIRSSGPTKEDFDVFNVLESVEIDAKLYPTVSRWKKFVGLYQQSERQHWPPLDSPRVKKPVRTTK